MDRKNKTFRRQKWLQIGLALVVITSMLAGCRFPWQKPEAADPTPHADSAGVSNAEPRADLPPALVEVQPLAGSVIGLDQPITLIFNQAMDADSVEAALRFDPAIDGVFDWVDDQTVTFTPDQPLTPDTRVTLSLRTSAQAANQVALQDAVEMDFQTSDSLKALQVVPADGSTDIDPESAIFVAFNQPVVALGAEAEGEPAFSLSPEVAGTGQWLNTSTYIFYPEPSMRGGTAYTVQINEGLVSTSGAGWDEAGQTDYDFATTQPEVMMVLPLPGEYLSLDGPLTVRFNIRMDAESVEDSFTLSGPDGDAVAGSFEWAEDLKSFEFYPAESLARNTAYTATLGPEAQSFGNLPLAETVTAARTTYPEFGLAANPAPEFLSYYGNFGEYSLTFTTPLDDNAFKDSISLEPAISADNLYLSNGGLTLHWNGYFKPETNYTLILDAELQDQWDGQLGQAQRYTFTTPPALPSLTVLSGNYSSDLAFIPAGASELVLQATNVSRVNLEIAPIPLDDLTNLLNPDNYNEREAYLPTELESSTQMLALERNTSEVVTLPLTYQGQELTPGAYFLRLSSPDITAEGSRSSQRIFLIVSENQLVMKISPEQAYVWASDLAGFAPLAGAPVEVYTTMGDLLASGETDAEGIFAADIDGYPEAYTSFYAVMGEPGDEDFGFASSSWGSSYFYYQNGISLNTQPETLDAYITTDRPIYRPGDTVHFNVLAFARENGVPADSGLESVQVSLHEDYGMAGVPAVLFDEELELDAYGVVSADVLIPADSAPGYYHIEVKSGETFLDTLYFHVENYRKPEIEVGVTLSPEESLAGESLSAEIQADYYFGLPVSGQTFTWTLYRQEGWVSLPAYRVGPLSTAWLMPRMAEFSTLGAYIASGEGQTDAQGQASLDFSPADLALDEVQEGSPAVYNLEVTVSDDSGFTVSARDSARVHPDEIYIGVQAETYFGVAESPFNFLIQTVDWDQNPVGDQPITATFETIEWQEEETGNPEQPYEYVAVTAFVASASPVTDGEGQARVSFTPENPGTYRLTLRSGNAVTQTIVWVSGSSSAIWPTMVGNQIELTADAESYLAGDTAEIFFPNPFPDAAKALVTVERGHVMEKQLVDVTGSGATVMIGLDEGSIPNVYVSVLLLGHTESGAPDYRQGIINLNVEPVEKTLQVQLTLDPTLTTPGEIVTAILEVTDAAGDPVQGEFSVAVVDKAVLALVEPVSLPILDDLYGNQPLSVETSFSLKTYAAQLALTATELGRGGGGGDMEVQETLREDFPDTAFWEASVVTGVDGTAQLTFPLPDSLTTWVVDVRGLTESFEVGQATGEIVTQKGLMVRPVTPRFLVAGDEVELAAVVHNNTDLDQEVQVRLQATGLALMDEATETQTVAIPANGSLRVSWWVKVDEVDSVELIFQADVGSLSDATRPTWGDLSVLRYLMPNTFSTSGQLTEAGERLELVSLPVSADPTAGSLSVELTPSLTGILIDGLEALTEEPLDNTASIVSRLMANLNAWQVLTDLDVDSPQLEADLVSLVQEDVRSLLDLQNFDGGWSWWSGEGSSQTQSDPFITAYALLNLEQAAEADLFDSNYALEWGQDYLIDHLGRPGEIDSGWQLDQLTFLIYALRSGEGKLGTITDGLYARRSDLSPWAEALLALTLHDLGGEADKVNTLLADLETRAVRSATGVNWESERASWRLPGTTIYNTAVSTYALAKLDPASTSLPMALRYLLVQRRASGIWSSSFESSWSLMAVAAALQGTGNYQADYEYWASLNDVLIAQGAAEDGNAHASVGASLPLDSLFADDPNALVIERGEGVGTLYYRVDLRTSMPAADSPAINKGLSLSRAYYLTGEGCPGEPDCEPIESFALDPDQPGQLVTAAITLVVPHDVYNLMVEDYIPSGTEVFNRNYLTSQSLMADDLPQMDWRRPFSSGYGWWYFNTPQIHDDHLTWTADYVPAGTYTLVYQLYPYQRGAFQVLPARAWVYFFPEVQGASAGAIFMIE
jgi:uncharacterized protein YfaS (alpha-2-macroglobulin family)